MATLWRVCSSSRPTIRALVCKSKAKCAFYRLITTTPKNKDSPATHANVEVVKTQEMKELEEHFADADPNKLKNWITHGWSNIDREGDIFSHHLAMFCVITLMFVGTGFVVYSLPDHKNHDWATREAYLDMDRREKLGLPLIDPYYVPPEEIELPPEDEIDIDIVI